MKRSVKFLSMLLLAVFALTTVFSCSKDDDPADNDFFAGTYKGRVTYTDTKPTNISVDDGKVFVTKIGDGRKYNFTFSNDIPAINGVEFKEEGDNVLVTIGETTAYIRIDKNTLKIAYTKDNKTWTANCTR